MGWKPKQGQSPNEQRDYDFKEENKPLWSDTFTGAGTGVSVFLMENMNKPEGMDMLVEEGRESVAVWLGMGWMERESKRRKIVKPCVSLHL